VHASDPAARWLPPFDNDSTICKTIPGCVPLAGKSSLHIDRPVSSGSPFVAGQVRETSQHLPKDQLDLSEDIVSDVVALIFSMCQQSYGAYVSAILWRLAISC
jgi:hypothetical protein